MRDDMRTYEVTDMCRDCRRDFQDLLAGAYKAGSCTPCSITVMGDESMVSFDYRLHDQGEPVRWSDGGDVTCCLTLLCPTVRVLDMLKGHTGGAYSRDVEERRRRADAGCAPSPWSRLLRVFRKGGAR